MVCHIGIILDNKPGKFVHILVKGINADGIQQILNLLLRQEHHALSKSPIHNF